MVLVGVFNFNDYIPKDFFIFTIKQMVISLLLRLPTTVLFEVIPTANERAKELKSGFHST
jgi:hypothetical protein